VREQHVATRHRPRPPAVRAHAGPGRQPARGRGPGPPGRAGRIPHPEPHLGRHDLRRPGPPGPGAGRGPCAGQVALVAGASRGIGQALALSLARGGASIVINYKKHADLAKKIDKLFGAAKDAYGRLDFFVANAAASSFKPIMELKQHHLDRSYAMNVRAFVLGAQRAVPLMDKGGRIVVLSSYGSIRAYPTYANLGAGKAAVEAWVRSMATEFAPRGINVNGVNGGVIESDSSDYFYNVPGMAPMLGLHHRPDPGRRRRPVHRGPAVPRGPDPTAVRYLRVITGPLPRATPLSRLSRDP
jgi:enoyl-[acyl-carrier protein] reductase III